MKYLKCAFLLTLCLLLTGCKKQIKPTTLSALKLNTYVSITVYDEIDQYDLKDAINLCDHYDKIFSKTNKDSELYRLNNREITVVSDDLKNVINTGIEYGNMTQGIFDISIGAVNSLWYFSGNNNAVPSASLIKEALLYVDYSKIQIEGNTVILPENMQLDLGAIAKGYIADRIKEFLTQSGVKNAIINLGGNVLCMGEKSKDEAFVIGVQKPFANTSEVALTLEIKDKTVVSAGIYERCFFVDDNLYHHIINPSTGYSYNNDLVAVTIICDKSETADALSTSCYSLGLNKGLELINSIDGCHAIFITKDYEIVFSKDFENYFKFNFAK